MSNKVAPQYDVPDVSPYTTVTPYMSTPESPLVGVTRGVTDAVDFGMEAHKYGTVKGFQTELDKSQQTPEGFITDEERVLKKKSILADISSLEEGGLDEKEIAAVNDFKKKLTELDNLQSINSKSTRARAALASAVSDHPYYAPELKAIYTAKGFSSSGGGSGSDDPLQKGQDKFMEEYATWASARGDVNDTKLLDKYMNDRAIQEEAAVTEKRLLLSNMVVVPEVLAHVNKVATVTISDITTQIQHARSTGQMVDQGQWLMQINEARNQFIQGAYKLNVDRMSQGNLPFDTKPIVDSINSQFNLATEMVKAIETNPELAKTYADNVALATKMATPLTTTMQAAGLSPAGIINLAGKLDRLDKDSAQYSVMVDQWSKSSDPIQQTTARLITSGQLDMITSELALAMQINKDAYLQYKPMLTAQMQAFVGDSVLTAPMGPNVTTQQKRGLGTVYHNQLKVATEEDTNPSERIESIIKTYNTYKDKKETIEGIDKTTIDALGMEVGNLYTSLKGDVFGGFSKTKGSIEFDPLTKKYTIPNSTSNMDEFLDKLNKVREIYAEMGKESLLDQSIAAINNQLASMDREVIRIDKKAVDDILRSETPTAVTEGVAP